jgi:hypothetical protein
MNEIGAGLSLANARNRLAELAAQPIVTSVYYNKKTLTLDGYTFRECRFDGCTLILHSPNFVLDHCVIDQTCVLNFGDQLGKVLQLFGTRYPSWWDNYFPGLVPTRNADGTISIGG